MSGCGCTSCNAGLDCPGGVCDVPSKKPAAVLFMADYGGNPFASTDQSYMPRPSGRVAGRPTEATQPRPAGATQQNFLAFPTLDGLLFQISQRPNLQKAINALSFRLFGQVYAVSDLVEMAVQNPTLSREFYRLVQQDIAANGYAQRAFASYNEGIGTNANYATDPNAAQPNDGSVPMGAPAPSYATDQNNGAYTPSYLDTKYLPRSRAAGQVRQRALTSQPRAEAQSVFAQAMAQAPSFNGFLGMDSGLALSQPRPAGAAPLYRPALQPQMSPQAMASLPNFASFLAPLDPFLSGRSRPLMYRPAGQVAGSAGGNVDAAQQAIQAVTQLAPSVIDLFRTVANAFNGAAPPDVQQRGILANQIAISMANILTWQSQANTAVAAAATVSDPSVQTNVAVTRAALAKVPAALTAIQKAGQGNTGAPLSTAEKSSLVDAAQTASELSGSVVQLKSALDAASAPGPTPGPTINNNVTTPAPSFWSSPWPWLGLAGLAGGGAYLYMNR